MGDNILLDMLKRVFDAGGILDWEAPEDRKQWMDESTVLMACESCDRPLLKLSDTLVTVVDSGEPLGLLKRARVMLLEAGKDLLEKHGK